MSGCWDRCGSVPEVSLRSTSGYCLATLRVAPDLWGVGQEVFEVSIWHPCRGAGIVVGRFRRYRCAQPPATVWQPFGLRLICGALDRRYSRFPSGTPIGVLGSLWVGSGGIAALNLRLLSGNPSGCA